MACGREIAWKNKMSSIPLRVESLSRHRFKKFYSSFWFILKFADEAWREGRLQLVSVRNKLGSKLGQIFLVV